MWDKNSLRNFILSIVKPIMNGKYTKQSGINAGLDNLIPYGSADNFRKTSPFGFISKVPVGVTAFYEALWGSSHENIIVAELDANRPEPSASGETILYSTDASGKTLKVKITLRNDGTLEINAPLNINITTQSNVNISAQSNVHITAQSDVSINCANAKITASTKATIACDNVSLGEGAVEKIINGETFQTFFNTHQHIGNIGFPTSPPVTPSDPSHLSNVVKAKK